MTPKPRRELRPSGSLVKRESASRPFWEEAFDKVKEEAGYGDAEILGIIAKVVGTTFMNHTNDQWQTEVEFPWSQFAGAARCPIALDLR